MPVTPPAERVELIARRRMRIAAEWLIRTSSASKQPPTEGAGSSKAGSGREQEADSYSNGPFEPTTGLQIGMNTNTMRPSSQLDNRDSISPFGSLPGPKPADIG